MANANDVADEEQRNALEREARLVTLLEAAKVMSEVQLMDCTTSKAVYQMKQALAFELVLSRLRRNDKDTVAVDSRGFPPGYGKPLGNALLHNTVVTTLQLTADNFPPPGIQHLFSAAQPWRDFLSMRSSVVKGQVRVGRVETHELFSFFLETVCANYVIPNHGQHLSPLQFKFSMTEPKSLREMKVHFANQRQRWTDEDKRCVTEGIQSNQNRLQRLSLYVDADEADGIRNEEDTMTAHVLKNLYLVQSLQALHLKFDEYFDVMKGMEGERGVLGMFNALEYYLQSIDSLCQLGFRGLLMDKTLMTKLLSGLGQTTAGVQRISVAVFFLLLI